MVPTPGVCLRGIQSINTVTLVTKVENPTVQPVMFEIPCAKTVQGLTPIPAAINRASPKPNRNKPLIRKHRDTIDGLVVNDFSELQNKFGIDLTDKHLLINLLLMKSFFNL